MNALDEATTIATQFNAKHSDVQLKIVRVTRPLTEDEVRTSAHKFDGWFLASMVFNAIRRRSPNHGEAVQAGRLLSKLGAETTKIGPHTAYRLDNLAATSAD